MKLLRRIQCTFAGHLVTESGRRGIKVMEWRCERCERLLVTHEDFPGAHLTVTPAMDRELEEIHQRYTRSA